MCGKGGPGGGAAPGAASRHTGVRRSPSALVSCSRSSRPASRPQRPRPTPPRLAPLTIQCSQERFLGELGEGLSGSTSSSCGRGGRGIQRRLRVSQPIGSQQRRGWGGLSWSTSSSCGKGGRGRAGGAREARVCQGRTSMRARGRGNRLAMARRCPCASLRGAHRVGAGSLDDHLGLLRCGRGQVQAHPAGRKRHSRQAAGH